jgi:hypothetical protein
MFEAFKLRFDEEPNYEHLSKILEEMVFSTGNEIDNIFDWIKPPAASSPVNKVIQMRGGKKTSDSSDPDINFCTVGSFTGALIGVSNCDKTSN